MVVTLTGGLAAATAQAAEAIAAAGWRLEPRGEACWQLLPAVDAAGAEGGWLQLTEGPAGTVELAAWLPEQGRAEPRERLEAALEALGPVPDGAASDGLLRRLRRIEGQVRGLQRMVAGGQECEAVLTQWSAVSMALKQAAAQLVAAHFIECIQSELEAGGDPQTVNRRLMNVLF